MMHVVFKVGSTWDHLAAVLKNYFADLSKSNRKIR